MKISKLLTISFLCLLILIPIVNAETLTGTLGGSIIGSYSSTVAYSNQDLYTVNSLKIKTVENSIGTLALVHFDTPSHKTGYIAGCPDSLTSVPFNLLNITGQSVIARGTFGYQRAFNILGVEIEGYQWLLFNSWENLSYIGGTGAFSLQINATNMCIATMAQGNSLNPSINGDMWFGDVQTAGKSGNYLRNVQLTTYAEYTATRPFGLGISGIISKLHSGIIYASRAYVFNGTSGAIISNNPTVNTADLLYNILDQPIKIGIQDPLGNWYNSSVLFTVIPTPTPTPSAWIITNISIYAKTQSGLPIQGAISEVHWGNEALYGAGTDINGREFFGLVSHYSGETFHLKIVKSDYYDYLSDFLIYNMPNINVTAYMIPIPTITPPPSWIMTNISYYVKTFSGIPISGALIEIFIYNQPIPSYLGITDSNGFLKINNIQHIESGIFDLKIFKTNYNTFTKVFSIPNVNDINETIYLTPYTIPTPTPAPYDVWGLKVIPTAINLGDSAQLNLTCSNLTKFAKEAGIVIYYENKNLGAYSSMDIIGIFLKNLTGSVWGFKPNISASYNYSALNNPVLFTVKPIMSGTYTYTVGIAKNNSESLGSATVNLPINSVGIISTNLVMTLSAHDGLTNSHLMNYTLILTEVISGISHTYDVNYDIEVNLQRGKVFTLTGQKIGYVDNTITFTVPLNQNIVYGDYGSFIPVSLFPIGTISAGNTTLTVHVADKETYYPIPNVQIVMSGFLTPKFTGTSGESVSFILPQNTAYTVIASKDGYCGVSESGNTSTRDYYYIDLYMKYGACLGVTPTHTPIPTPTPTPTPTPIYYNFTGTVTICNNLPVNASAIDHIKNQLACFGITDLIGQNLALAVLIILGIGLIAALKAGAIGFAIGGVLGAVISMVMGLIPFFIIVVLVICSIAILAIKIFFTPG